MRRILLASASLALGGLLVLFLMRLGRVDIHSVVQQLRNVSVTVLTKLALLNIALIFLSTEKWRRVDAAVRRSSDSVPSRAAAFGLTSAGMALGLVFPVQLGMATARTLGTYFYGRPLERGTAGTLFEQSFDLLIVCFLAVASSVTWLFHRGAGTWAACAVAMIAIALLSVGPAMRVIRRIATFAADKLGPSSHIGSGLKNMSDLEESGLLSSTLARRLVILSALRFGIVVLMARETALAIGAPISLWQMAAMVPFVVVTNVLAITPGGIGVNELTAVTALKTFGVPTATAAEWSLANRVLIMASSFLVGSLALAGVAIMRLKGAVTKHERREMDVTK